MPTHLPIVTVSSMRCYRRCAREYYYRYERGYVSVERATSLRFGSVVHKGLEILLSSGWDLEKALAESMSSEDSAELNAFDIVKAEVMLRGYSARWSAEPLEVIAVEKEFRAAVVNPATGASSRTFDLAGKLDGLVRDVSSSVFVLEHKTSAEDITSGSSYWEKLRLDSQISSYYVGARSLGYEPAGVLYDVLKKPTLKPYKATPEESRKYTKAGALYASQRDTDETPDEYRTRLLEAYTTEPESYFARGEVVRLEEEERDAAQDVWQQARCIRESQVLNRWPRNPENCERYHCKCEFWSVCTKTADIEDETRYRIERAHRELSLEVAA